MSVKTGFKKFFSEISARHKYVFGDKGLLEQPYKSLKKKSPKKTMDKIGRIAGLGGVDLIWFLFCLGKYTTKDTKNGLNFLLLDNGLLDRWEQEKGKTKIENTDSAFKKFFKNLQKSHPKAAARLQLWMVYALFTGLTISGMKIVKDKDDIKQIDKEFVSKQNANSEPVKIDYEEFKKSLSKVTPWLIADLISKEGVHLDKNGLHAPYKDSKGIWTIGFGSTVLKNGERVKANTRHMTNEEVYELTRWHIEDYETFPMLYWYYVYDNDLLFKTINEAVGMGSIFYNAVNKLVENKNDKNNKQRFTLLRRYRDGNTNIPCAGYGANIPEELILECFEKYPITSQFSFGTAWLNHEGPQRTGNAVCNFCAEGGGIFWRRWLEAGLLTGNINPKDLLECPIDGVADFYKYMGGWTGNNKDGRRALFEYDGSDWQPKDGTYDIFKEWLQKPVTKDRKGRVGLITRQKIKDFLPNEILKYLINTEYDVNSKVFYMQKSKVAAFNSGVKKIQIKQSGILRNISRNNDYLA